MAVLGPTSPSTPGDTPSGRFATLSSYRASFPTGREAVMIERGVREQDPTTVIGDLLSEWDILFYPFDPGDTAWSSGNVLARRVRRRDRFSRTTIDAGDSHPVIVVAAVPDLTAGRALWQRAIDHSIISASLIDLLAESTRGPAGWPDTG